MNVGFIGLGKLGFPCAAALATKGHKVFGYDSNPKLVSDYIGGKVPEFEPGLKEQYDSAKSRMEFCESIDEVVSKSKIIFVAVPTPHAPTHDGSFPYDGVPRDFDNSIIRDCLVSIGKSITKAGSFKTVLVISTVTPGTMESDLYPAMKAAVGTEIGEGWDLIYNPFFIGQGSVVRDFLNPEFVLLGFHSIYLDEIALSEMEVLELYRTLHNAPLRWMRWSEAECVKLCYNTYLGLKVLFANTVMETCHRLGADCDVVNGTLKLATDRLVSTKYMDGGMADGGPCHGRDQMAMSHVAKRLKLSFDIFDVINRGRDAQTGFLADLIEKHRGKRDVMILGMAFKPNTNQTQGSPALLLANILRSRGIAFQFSDPALRELFLSYKLDGKEFSSYLFFLATPWEDYLDAGRYAKPGDIIIDPWGKIGNVPAGVELIRVGREQASSETTAG